MEITEISESITHIFIRYLAIRNSYTCLTIVNTTHLRENGIQKEQNQDGEKSAKLRSWLGSKHKLTK